MSEQLAPKHQLGKKEVVFHLTDRELDEFIIKEYNPCKKGSYQYESVAEEEWNNYSSYEFNMKKQPMSEYNINDLEKRIKDGEGNYCTRLFLQDAVNNDVIEEGLYIVKVSW